MRGSQTVLTLLGALIVTAVAAIGLLQAVAGWIATARFADRKAPGHPPGTQPITVLKPLHGDEPLLEPALASVCAQDYPAFQIVFGVGDPADPALAVVQRLRERFPATDIAVVVNPARHGPNGKVGNLINMLPAAKHDVLVIADSDLHVQPDYLARLAEALDQPGTGLVTTLYAGLPATGTPRRPAGRHADHPYLPARRVAGPRAGPAGLPGRHHGAAAGDADPDRRPSSLGEPPGRRQRAGPAGAGRRAGGAAGRYRARDHRAGNRAGPRCCATNCAGPAPSARWRPASSPPRRCNTRCSGPRWRSRWRAEPPGPGRAFCFAWVIRALAATGVDRAPLLRSCTELAFPCPVWLLPMRDWLSIGILLASYAGRRVEWRGVSMHADTPPPLRRSEGPNLR